MAFVLNSPAFPDGHEIPRKHARDGENLSPPLEWQDPPPGTQSYMLIVEDPDAPSGTFRHWAVYNIDAGRNRLPEGVSAGGWTDSLSHGVNDFGNPQYDGPQPPRGHGKHHYHFRLGALDVPSLDLPPTASTDEVLEEARPHIIAEAEMVGTYER